MEKMTKNTHTMDGMENQNSKTYPFKRGWSQVPVGLTRQVKGEIMQTLHLSTHMSWYRRLRGDIPILAWEKEVLEKIFSRYGITDIWGSEMVADPRGQSVPQDKVR